MEPDSVKTIAGRGQPVGRRGCGPLEIAVELDAIGRVYVHALYLAAQAFAFRKRSHDLQRVAKDHPVGPVLLVGSFPQNSPYSRVTPIGEVTEARTELAPPAVLMRRTTLLPVSTKYTCPSRAST